MDSLGSRKKGILLAFLGIIVLSPDSLFVRIIDVPFYTLMFWRGFFMFLSLSLFLWFDTQKSLVYLWLNVNKPTLVMSLLFVVSSFLFVLSLMLTSVAHTLLIVGTSPIFAAFFSWLMLKEIPQKRMLFAIVIIILALALVVQQDEQLVTLKGDFYAFLSAIIMGYTFVYVRLHLKTNLMLALSLSGLWMAIVSLPLATSLQVSLSDGSLLFILGALVGGAFSLITLSARYMPPAMSSMFMPLETVFGVFLVWLFIGEEPSMTTILGGLIIIATLLLISVYDIKEDSKRSTH